MNQELNEMIIEFKKGDVNQFLLIQERLKPVMNKYVRLLFRDEKEDTMAELDLSLLEAVHNIVYFENEGQCFIYFYNALRNRYLELYKRSRRKFDYECSYEAQEGYEPICQQDDFAEINLKEDIGRVCSDYSEKQKKILFSILFDNKTSTLAARENNVSRQYVNRIKRRLYQEMKKEYYLE